MASKRYFQTYNGKATDIFHSHEYAKKKYQERNQLAFNKPFLDTLTDRDKYLMRGYAQAIVERQSAFSYNHPEYVPIHPKKVRPPYKKG